MHDELKEESLELTACGDEMAQTEAEIRALGTKDAEVLLRESERHYRDLFGHAPIGAWVYDFSGAKRHIDELRANGVDDVAAYCEANQSEMLACMGGLCAVDVNRAALEMYGATSAEELLKPRPTQLTPEMVDAARNNISAIASGQLEATFEARSRKVTGEIMDVLIRWRVAAGHEQDYARVFMFIVDVSDMHRSMEAVARYESRYRAIFECTPLGLRIYRLNEQGQLILEAVNDAADRLLHIDHGPRIGMTIEEAFPAVVGTPLPDRIRDVIMTGEQWRTEQFSYDDGEISGYFEVHVFRAEPNTAAVMFEDVTRRRQQEQQLEKYRTELEQMVAERTRALERASAERDAVTSIAIRLVEARDPYTAGHQRRVAELVREIAIRMGMSDEEVAIVHIAAQLHDIGKVSVPSDILSKPAALTATEYMLVQEHSETGFNILQSANLSPHIARLVREHHERLDGSGYPKGLKGDEITLGARILAVADTVEAMASHRPYRPALGIELALAEIEHHSRSHYDPDVVECCKTLFAEGFEFTAVE